MFNWFKERIVRLHSKHSKKIRFLIAGAVNTLVGLAAYPVLYFYLNPNGIGYLVILMITQVFCVSFSFVSNKFFVFKTKGNIKSEYSKFFTFHALYFLINLAALPVMVEVFSLNPMVAQVIFSLLIISTSFYWHNYITFNALKGRVS